MRHVHTWRLTHKHADRDTGSPSAFHRCVACVCVCKLVCVIISEANITKRESQRFTGKAWEEVCTQCRCNHVHKYMSVFDRQHVHAQMCLCAYLCVCALGNYYACPKNRDQAFLSISVSQSPLYFAAQSLPYVSSFPCACVSFPLSGRDCQFISRNHTHILWAMFACVVFLSSSFCLSFYMNVHAHARLHTHILSHSLMSSISTTHTHACTPSHTRMHAKKGTHSVMHMPECMYKQTHSLFVALCLSRVRARSLSFAFTRSLSLFVSLALTLFLSVSLYACFPLTMFLSLSLFSLLFLFQVCFLSCLLQRVILHRYAWHCMRAGVRTHVMHDCFWCICKCLACMCVIGWPIYAVCDK
jgi:hypothetical protein